MAEVACQASYVWPEGQPVYLCTQVTVNGTTYYWDASAVGVDPNLPGDWSLSGGLCNEAISREIFPGPLAPVLDAIPVDAVVIISLPDGSEPIHTNVGNSDCSTYSWDSMTGVYDVDCTTAPARACGTVAAVAVGAPGLTGTSSCGTLSATATSPGTPVAVDDMPASMTPWGCVLSGGPGGVVVCVIDGGSGGSGPSPNQVAGRRCSFASVTNPTAPGQVQTGEISGGPLAHPTATLSLRCTVQTGPGGATHVGADAASAGIGTALVPPTPVTYSWAVGDPIYVCSQLTFSNGTQYYWDAVGNAWSTSSGVSCDAALKQQVAPVPLVPSDVASGGTWIVCGGSEDATVCV